MAVRKNGTVVIEESDCLREIRDFFLEEIGEI